MMGFVLNTHQQYLCKRLVDLGYRVERQVAIADSGPAIAAALTESLGRADMIIVTGGLGPTSDDRTRDLVSELLRRPLRQDADVLVQIEHFFAIRGSTPPERARVQALVPEGAIVLMNAHGTAPGLILEVVQSSSRCWVVMLPGPPRELRPMFEDQVIPFLTKVAPAQLSSVCKTLRTAGLGESFLEERIEGPMRELVAAGLELGYCARFGEVDVRLACMGKEAEAVVSRAEALLRQLVGEYVIGTEQDQLEVVVVQLLAQNKKWIATAESCTGGYIANRITNVPGASSVFMGGVVTYSNELKEKLLGVRQQTLSAEGAVSAATALEMAEGARMRLGADLALAVTGIAGPGGGTASKPVGTVYLALATAAGTEVVHKVHPHERDTFKQVTSQRALDMVRRHLLGLPQVS